MGSITLKKNKDLVEHKGRRIQRFIATLYIVPAMVIIGIVIVYSSVKVVISSFMTMSGGEEVFTGLRNYELLFKDELFYTAIRNNLILFLCVPVMTVLALVVAVILYEKIKGWQFYRSLIFVPFILAVPVVGVVFTYILQLNGVLNTLLRDVGMGSLAVDWLGNPSIAIWSVGAVIIWKQFGFGVILFLARLMSVDPSLYESAEVDGANWIQKFTNITIPVTMPIIEFYVIISLIDMLSWVFAFIFVMTGGGPGQSTTVLEYMIYKKSFASGNFHYAQAVCVIVLIVATLLIVFQQILARRSKNYE